jgi:hypothetical protein
MLRFSAVFKNRAPQDRFRKFVIVFDLSDDTVAVFELPQPNSGFREGKFIQRDRIRNYLAGNGNFVASNFRAGDEMTLNGFTFLTTNADEYAKTLMEAQCSSYPQADLAEVFVDLKRDKHAVAAVRTAMEPFDKLENSSVDPAAAPQVITRLFGIPQHEAMTAVRRWTNDWGFDYYAFGTHLTA